LRIMEKFIVLFVLGIFFGCISNLAPPIQLPAQNETTECKNITVKEPYVSEVCQNVSKMEQVCATRELNYSLSEINKTVLCIERNLCVNYYSNGSCATWYCSKGMVRCKMTLTNLDSQKAGSWSMGANFTLDGNVFQKNIETETLLPNESAVYDYYQLYTMDINQKNAVCNIFVTEPAKLQDCISVSKAAVECKNITGYKDVSTQECQ